MVVQAALSHGKRAWFGSVSVGHPKHIAGLDILSTVRYEILETQATEQVTASDPIPIEDIFTTVTTKSTKNAYDWRTLHMQTYLQA
eukprot:s4692_g4.t1